MAGPRLRPWYVRSIALTPSLLAVWRVPPFTAKADPAIPFLLPVADEDGANAALAPEGTCDAQILRSCSRWSSGISTEVSIYTAYIEGNPASQPPARLGRGARLG